MYNTEYKNYLEYITIMISTDRGIFDENSYVRKRMIEVAKSYKVLHIIVFSTQKYKNIKVNDNVYIYSTNSLFKINYLFNSYNIGKGIIKSLNKIEKILISCQNPFETGIVGFFLKKLKINIELLIQIHTDLFNPLFIKHSFMNRMRVCISRYVLRQAQTIRVVSKRIADSLVDRGFDKDKIILKPIEINTEIFENIQPRFDLHKKFPQFKKIVLMVSRLEPEKNIEMAIRAVSLIAKHENSNIYNIGLVIIGDGKSFVKLKKLVDNLKIREHVIFEGRQTDTISYYKGCDVFLMTSWYEGYGMVLKEAQTAGCRIVSTDAGIAREVGAEIVGWNDEEVAEKIEKVLAL